MTHHDDQPPSFGRVFSTVWKAFMAILLIIVILGFGFYLIALAAQG